MATATATAIDIHQGTAPHAVWNALAGLRALDFALALFGRLGDGASSAMYLRHATESLGMAVEWLAFPACLWRRVGVGRRA